MGNAPLTRQLLGPGLYLALAAMLVLARLVPLPAGSGGLPGPDLLFCLTMAWVLRRPDLLPAGLVAVVALGADLLLQRPPGLWAVLMVLAAEYLRGRGQPGQEPSFGGEVMLVGLLYAGMVLANWTLLVLFLVPHPPLLAMLAQVPATLLAYPLMVLALVHLFVVRRRAESSGDLSGRRA